MRFVETVLGTGVLCSALVISRAAGAATIDVGPSDSFDKIEGAGPGDEVVIAPGTYRFRVYLQTAAPANNPIVIRAQDPGNPPVWDLSGGYVEDAPGSYTAGDRGRGCWQISGGTNYHISGIVVTGCHNAAANSAGMRYYNGATGIVLSDWSFHDNDNGLTGGTQDSEITVEFSEFDANGTLLASSSAPSHNIYVYGGTFALRYSFVHDPVQAQNFHIRAHDATIEYNWFARARSYEGDLMTDDDYGGTGGFQQTMVLRGNVIVQDAAPNNDSQIVAVYNDAGASGLSLNVELYSNTLVGNGGHAALVHLANSDGTSMSAKLVNNVISGTSVPTLVDDAANGSVTGSNNWLATGTAAGPLGASVFGADPGFKNAPGMDFTLASSSDAIGKATALGALGPTKEYYRDETVTRRYRVRATAKDLGAFESTTAGAVFGPYGQQGGGGQGAGGSSAAGGGGGATTGGGNGVAGTSGSGTTTGSKDSSGCGCRVADRPGAPGAPWLSLLVIGALRARRSRRSR